MESEQDLDTGQEQKAAEINQMAEVSLNSVAGLTSPKTMKLRGTIEKQEAVILIDPDATHNFILLQLVRHKQIPITKTGSYGVTMGTGGSIKGEGVCRGVNLQVQGLNIVDEFLLLNLGSDDIILGIQWLEKLGTV